MKSQPQFKTKPFAHQLKAYNLSKDEEYFALLLEQGCGKSKVVIDNAAFLFAAGRINALVVVSPNGVQRNWVLNEVPTHMPAYCDPVSAWWSSTPSKAEKAALRALTDPEQKGLRVICINIEALTTNKGAGFLDWCLTMFNCLLAVDESTRIKNPKAQCSKVLHKLGRKALFRRILTGTPVTQSPVDLFSQFAFLDPFIMGTQSFVTFKATYCELLPQGHGLMRHIEQRMKPGLMARYRGDVQKVNDHIAKYAPQVVARDAEGRPKYRNLDKLQAKIAGCSYRVRKADCLDLPDKLYQRLYHELVPAQRRVYDALRKDFRVQLDSGKISTVTKLTCILRLQQVVSGYGPDDDEKFTNILVPLDKNPRIQLLLDAIEELEGGVIIWARFRREISDIASALEGSGHSPDEIVQYHGGVKNKDRSEAVAAFQAGKAKYFVAQQHSGGMGLTLTAARTVVYYSNDFSLEARLQSEDRAHRIGQHNPVTYIDLEAVDTIDNKIITSLRNKKSIADVITGDPVLPWM